jgi:hypothetical protein
MDKGSSELRDPQRFILARSEVGEQGPADAVRIGSRTEQANSAESIRTGRNDRPLPGRKRAIPT